MFPYINVTKPSTYRFSFTLTIAMAVFPFKLYKISRAFFVIIIIAQGFLLSKYVVDHEGKSFYGVAGVFIILSLFTYFGTLCVHGGLKNRLGVAWFFYMVAFVVMICWIFGDLLIHHNKLRTEMITTDSCNDSVKGVMNSSDSDSFFDSKSLKITLCFTPGEMLLLLTSVADESGAFKLIYLTTVMDLFDGIEMLEVLHENVCSKIPREMEFVVLAAASLFFLLSSFQVHQVKFDEDDDPKSRKKTTVANTISQIILNLTFLVIRLVLWFHYDFDSAIFIAKNVIGLAIAIVPMLERAHIITTEID